MKVGDKVRWKNFILLNQETIDKLDLKLDRTYTISELLGEWGCNIVEIPGTPNWSRDQFEIVSSISSEYVECFL